MGKIFKTLDLGDDLIESSPDGVSSKLVCLRVGWVTPLFVLTLIQFYAAAWGNYAKSIWFGMCGLGAEWA